MAKVTLNDTLKVQFDNLNDWMIKLRLEYFNALQAEVNKQNESLTPSSVPYSVFRGNDMVVFSQNLHL